ncbi:Chorismate mutase AroH [bioreactor metagenome]|uniref:Chorismate mutase AroH n=1 Tax=bioreactor metagenome TaxID=1076179 RepID=A0A645J4W3_9ZZZZ|nr:chorismate mutase [Lachnospiraceae bacterium]
MGSVSIRGATTVEKNESKEILAATEELLKEILDRNNIQKEDIQNIIFTSTGDIDAAYPAVSARNMGIRDAALMCFQEMHVEGSLKMCIRIMLTAESQMSQKDVKHVYLKGSKVLRPDIA